MVRPEGSQPLAFHRGRSHPDLKIGLFKNGSPTRSRTNQHEVDCLLPKLVRVLHAILCNRDDAIGWGWLLLLLL